MEKLKIFFHERHEKHEIKIHTGWILYLLLFVFFSVFRGQFVF